MRVLSVLLLVAALVALSRAAKCTQSTCNCPPGHHPETTKVDGCTVCTCAFDEHDDASANRRRQIVTFSGTIFEFLKTVSVGRFKKLLRRTHQLNQLDDPNKSFTVFPFSNEAHEAFMTYLTAVRTEDELAPDVEESVAKYHIIGKRMTPNKLKRHDDVATLFTAQPDLLDTASLFASKMITRMYRCDNGYVYIINTVLAPPSLQRALTMGDEQYMRLVEKRHKQMFLAAAAANTDDERNEAWLIGMAANARVTNRKLMFNLADFPTTISRLMEDIGFERVVMYTKTKPFWALRDNSQPTMMLFCNVLYYFQNACVSRMQRYIRVTLDSFGYGIKYEEVNSHTLEQILEQAQCRVEDPTDPDTLEIEERLIELTTDAYRNFFFANRSQRQFLNAYASQNFTGVGFEGEPYTLETALTISSKMRQLRTVPAILVSDIIVQDSETVFFQLDALVRSSSSGHPLIMKQAMVSKWDADGKLTSEETYLQNIEEVSEWYGLELSSVGA